MYGFPRSKRACRINPAGHYRSRPSKKPNGECCADYRVTKRWAENQCIQPVSMTTINADGATGMSDNASIVVEFAKPVDHFTLRFIGDTSAFAHQNYDDTTGLGTQYYSDDGSAWTEDTGHQAFVSFKTTGGITTNTTQQGIEVTLTSASKKSKWWRVRLIGNVNDGFYSDNVLRIDNFDGGTIPLAWLTIHDAVEQTRKRSIKSMFMGSSLSNDKSYNVAIGGTTGPEYLDYTNGTYPDFIIGSKTEATITTQWENRGFGEGDYGMNHTLGADSPNTWGIESDRYVNGRITIDHAEVVNGTSDEGFNKYFASTGFSISPTRQYITCVQANDYVSIQHDMDLDIKHPNDNQWPPDAILYGVNNTTFDCWFNTVGPSAVVPSVYARLAIALNNTAGKIFVGTYTGDGVNGRTLDVGMTAGHVYWLDPEKLRTTLFDIVGGDWDGTGASIYDLTDQNPTSSEYLGVDMYTDGNNIVFNDGVLNVDTVVYQIVVFPSARK